MNPHYIIPEIVVHDTLKKTLKRNDEFFDPWLDNEYHSFDLPSINDLGCLFIIGEPGYGKTQLIAQLRAVFSENKTLLIDCREFADQRENKDFSSYTHLYFDGLDEVPPILFLESLNRIREIRDKNIDKKIFIACRTHYITRFERYVIAFKDAKFLQIQPFREFHIRKYLDKFLDDPELIDAIISRSSDRFGGESVLKTPRYLAALVKSINEQQISSEEVKTMRRTDIFEKVIYYQLISEVKRQSEKLQSADSQVEQRDPMRAILAYLKEQEARKYNLNEIELTKRVLEKLAFIMEIYQRNRITKDELTTFLDETQSNINQIFLNNSSIDRFIERTLKSVEGTFLEFEHTEFQEYLAAKELIRMSNSPQVLYDLILQKDVQVIYASWLDVLQYAIELDADKVVTSLANYIENNADRQTDDKLIDILMGPGVEGAEPIVKGKLFQAIYQNFQSSGKILYHKNDLLATLYVPELNENYLRIEPQSDYEIDDIRRFVNQILLVRSIATNAQLPASLKQAWKEHLLKCLNIISLKDQYEIMLWTLETLEAEEELKQLSSSMENQEHDQLSPYLLSIGRICADDMVDFFIRILETKTVLVGKEDFLASLKTENGITSLFKKLVETPMLIRSLFSNEHRFVSFHRLFDHISKIDSKDLHVLSENLLYTILGDDPYPHSSGNEKEFVDNLFRHLLVKRDEFLSIFLAKEYSDDIIDQYLEAFAQTINIEQFSQIYDALHKDLFAKREIYKIIEQLKHSGNQARQELYTAVHQRYPQLFELVKTEQEASDQKIEREKERLHKQLEKLIMTGRDFYHPELFQFYLGNREKLANIITQEQIDYIKEQLTHIIEQVNPDTYKVTLDRQGDKLNFRTNSQYWHSFGYYVNAAIEMQLDEILSANRIKVLKYLPLLNQYMINQQDYASRFIDYLGDISEEEVHMLFDFCTKRHDHYIYSSAATFANLIARLKLYIFKPVLKLMISAEITDIRDKQKALMAYGELSDEEADKQYLREIFDAYDEGKDEKTLLSTLANEILIKQFMDQTAIDWRFDQLTQRAKPYQQDTYPSGFSPYSEWEQELDRPRFADAFNEIDHERIRRGMDQLLSFSLDLYKKPDFGRYGQYLQTIVFNYYNKYNNLTNLNRIRSILTKQTNSNTAGTFKSFVRSLEINLTNSFELYKTISEPIKLYNEIKNKRYIPVRTTADLAALVNMSIADLESFVKDKGYYQTAAQLSGAKKAKTTSLFNEDILQKTFQVTLENSLLRRGLRGSDIHREVELFDGKRLDILLKYGFVGPIMAEMKLLHNSEIMLPQERKRYKNKMKQYVAATKSEYSYYLVFKVREDTMGKDQKAFDALVIEYADVPNLTIKLINCLTK